MRPLCLILFCLALPGLSHADTMECYNGILDTAAPNPPDKQTVRQRCGEPDLEIGDGSEWRYEKRHQVYLLRFDQRDRLIDIQQQSADADDE